MLPLTFAQGSHELSPASDKHTDQDRHKSVIGLSDLPLCRLTIDTNSDRYHRIDRKQQAPARARSGACHHSPAESLIIILSNSPTIYTSYRPSPFTYIISLLPTIHIHLHTPFLPPPLNSTSPSKMAPTPDGAQLERVESYQVGIDARNTPP
jgi:hypothetical protein